MRVQDQEHLFVVGTEEGAIHKCSTAYNSEYLATFEGHMGPVHKLHWNPLKPNIFLSASADWTVRLWDESAHEVSGLAFCRVWNRPAGGL